MNRLINADELLARAEHEANGMTGDFKDLLVPTLSWLINKTSTAYDPDKVVKELEERTDFLKNCTKYGNKNAEQQDKSYSTMMMYEVADLVEDLIEIVKQGGVSEAEQKLKEMGE